MYYLLLFHDNNVYANVPQCSYIHTVHAETAYFKTKLHSVVCKIKINIHTAMIMKVAARIH